VSVLLFVCTGNLCRSPMAEALLRQRLEDANLTPRVQVRSAGVWAQEGRPASAEAIEVMAERALDIEDHRAHVLTAEDMAPGLCARRMAPVRIQGAQTGRDGGPTARH
jgi:protein-tyrosine-phosphatase